jgi:hypothetical protein
MAKRRGRIDNAMAKRRGRIDNDMAKRGGRIANSIAKRERTNNNLQNNTTRIPQKSILSFPNSFLTTVFLTRVTRLMSLIEQ